MKTSSCTDKGGRPQTGYYKKNINDREVVRTAFPVNGPYYIYGLSSSLTPSKIEYIGSTRLPMNKRYNSHKSTASLNHSSKQKWINQIQQAGEHFIMIIIKEGLLSAHEASSSEKNHIKEYKDAKLILKNETDGGIGKAGCRHSNATRKKMSATKKGRKQTKEHVEKRIASIAKKRVEGSQ